MLRPTMLGRSLTAATRRVPTTSNAQWIFARSFANAAPPPPTEAWTAPQRNIGRSAPKMPVHRLVILGTGWAGYRLMLQCRKHRADMEYVTGRAVDIVVVSRRNHFLYTPLLASTTVGTLGFHSIMEPLRDVMFSHETDFHYASVLGVDPELKQLQVQSEINQRKYTVDYDTLVIASGAKPMTFGIPGVEENAFFLKEAAHAQKIRNRIIENFELATQPNVTPEERDRLLHFVVVGGGPTGVEFCAELYDFLQHDLTRMYPQASQHLRVSLLDAGEILTGFDVAMRDFALKKLKSRKNMEIIKKNCSAVDKESVTLQGGDKIPCGMVVWTAGVGPNDLTKSLTCFEKSKRGNILTNEYFQVLGAPEVEAFSPMGLPLRSNVFSIGDCAEIRDYPLPPTAQKAESQANYLVELFCKQRSDTPPTPYAFHSKGIMAYLGGHEALFEIHKAGKTKSEKAIVAKLRGWKAWMMWRSAYFTKLTSWRLRLQVPLDWIKATVTGRDVSHF